MSLKEFKERNRKTFTTVNGLEVTVRRLPAFVLMQYGPIPNLETADPATQADISAKILKAALVSPKLGDGDDELSLHDLPMEDFNEILLSITGFETRTPAGGEADEASPLEGTG